MCAARLKVFPCYRGVGVADRLTVMRESELSRAIKAQAPLFFCFLFLPTTSFFLRQNAQLPALLAYVNHNNGG